MKRSIKATLISAALSACAGGGMQASELDDGMKDRPVEHEGYNGITERDAPEEQDDPSSEYGTVEQGLGMFMSFWQGWQTNTATRPRFLDIGSTDFAIKGICGAPMSPSTGTAGGGCLLPKGTDERTQWTWRWDRTLCGSLDIGVAGSYSGTAFITALRSAMSEISSLTGVTMVEVTSGEHITLFCDANAVSVIDPELSTGAAWYAFGSSSDTQRSAIETEDRGCAPRGSSTKFRSTPIWTYASAGISLNQDVLGNPNGDGWADPRVCAGATDPRKPNFMANVFRNVVLHEMMHHFGFGHYGNFPLMKANLPCTIGDQPFVLQSTFRNAISGLNTRRCTGDACLVMFRVDRDLECLSPDILTNAATGVGAEVER